jgi:hypothetical protein
MRAGHEKITVIMRVGNEEIMAMLRAVLEQIMAPVIAISSAEDHHEMQEARRKLKTQMAEVELQRGQE